MKEILEEIKKCKLDLDYLYEQGYYHYWKASDLSIEDAIKEHINKYGLQLSLNL